MIRRSAAETTLIMSVAPDSGGAMTGNDSYVYGADFMAYTDRISHASAAAIIEYLLPILAPKSVVDFGCAKGTWLSVWKQAGGCEVIGLDGDYVSRSSLRIPEDAFQSRDLRQPLALGRRFDLAQSLEVAEHLPESRAAGFVADLVAHADVVLFAAARPGQGGEHHINEQPYEYWRALFRRYGFVAIDLLRPALVGQHQVSSWYRYNTVLYVARHRLAGMPAEIIAAQVPEDQPLADFAPLWFRARCALVRLLPIAVQDAISRLTARMRK